MKLKMKNKTYFIKQLCSLRNLDPEGEEAKEMQDMKVVDLLIAIKEATPKNQRSEIEEEVEEDDDESFANRAGCRF